jgi:site-specific recombinase XerD
VSKLVVRSAAGAEPSALFSEFDAIEAQRVERVRPGYNRAPREECMLGVGDDIAAIADWLSLANDVPTTYRSYRKEAERFYVWLVYVAQKDLGSFVRSDIDAYREFVANPPEQWCRPRWKRREPGSLGFFEGALSPTSQAVALSIVGGLFSHLAAGNYLLRNPFAITRIRRRKAQQQAASMATVDVEHLKGRFLPEKAVGIMLEVLERRAIEQAAESRKARAYAERELFVVRFLLNTGLRRVELANALMGHIRVERDLSDNRDVHVMSVLGKGSVPRTIAINSVAHQALQRYRASVSASTGYFGNASPILLPVTGKQSKVANLGEDLVYSIVKSALEHTREAYARTIDPDPETLVRLRTASPHWFRHSFATMLNNRGVPLTDVKELLGHGSIETTMVYTHTVNLQLVRSVERLTTPVLESRE